MRSEPPRRTTGTVEIPFTDDWMNAQLPTYEGGRTLLEPEYLNGIEERAAAAKARLSRALAAEAAKLRAKDAPAGKHR